MIVLPQHHINNSIVLLTVLTVLGLTAVQSAFAPGKILPQFGLLGDWLSLDPICPGGNDKINVYLTQVQFTDSGWCLYMLVTTTQPLNHSTTERCAEAHWVVQAGSKATQQQHFSIS